MRKYWGAKAIVVNNMCVGFGDPEVFTQYGEMSDGTKIYTDNNGEQFIRQKIHGKYLFVHL